MELFPAIDILDGSVVRLAQGSYDDRTIYHHDPATIATEFAQAGARWVHVVDLNAARGEARDNREAISKIAALGCIDVEVGGGMRTIERLQAMVDAGVKRLVIGTALIANPGFAEEAVARFSEKIVAGIDAKGGRVALQGWTQDSGVDALEAVAALSAQGIQHLVFTEVERDGMQTGLDLELYKRVADAANFPVVASGGVATLKDIREIRGLGDDVIEGIITGKALYEGAFTLADALEAIEKAE